MNYAELYDGILKLRILVLRHPKMFPADFRWYICRTRKLVVQGATIEKAIHANRYSQEQLVKWISKYKEVHVGSHG